MSDDQLSPRARRQQKLLIDISDTAIRLFIAQGFHETTMDQIAAAAEVSARTLYRYFPTKEDVITPALQEGWSRYVAAFSERPGDESVIESLLVSADAAARGHAGERTRSFVRELLTSPPLRPTWLRIQTSSHDALRPHLARRLHLDAESVQARVVAACVGEANRIAVESAAKMPPEQFVSVLRDCLEALGPMLHPPARGPGAAPDVVALEA
ncbi:TetR/AcrR family transcriptional regulator [Gordonia jinhuaensis]|uniref:TetR/AcrR family transcriptional regulator n=1 Tax=Gordonia jinhuaensis TaxID=1517702 RepID=UPI001669C2F4|nr:TetR/AcrR family transcriptional regulator [Gordonia jinhuaensis]